jgi:Mrp family chromosome partitioning ATPase
MGTHEEREMQDEKIRWVTARIDQKLLIMSGKGGVGKSSVAANLAVTLSHSGASVGLLDVDLHGPSIPRLLGLTGKRVLGDGEHLVPLLHRNGLRVVSIGSFLDSGDNAVIWRGPRKTGAIRQFIADVAWGRLDYLIIDSPPGTGDEPMSVIQTLPDARAVIVTTPQALSLDDVRKSITFCRSLEAPVVGVIENMSGLACPHCGGTIDLFGSGGGEVVCREMDVPFLGRIPIDPDMVRAGDSGDPYMEHCRFTPAAHAFSAITEAILAELGVAGKARVRGLEP